jgi:hypothetical protein
MPDPSGTGYHVQFVISLIPGVASAGSIMPANCWHSGHHDAPNQTKSTFSALDAGASVSNAARINIQYVVLMSILCSYAQHFSLL